jgi:cellulose synthase/poly-beta-1,6-N-acetylglucosamine synthase-like glycosyltransferase
MATLDALARLRYPNFEVLVIDNNTKDRDLWRPVEEHCRRLGERFRFFHLDRCSGAKAGALNFALGQTAPDAELVGVIDADYQAEPDFIAALVGYFDDPRMGFVQTPHDYREWKSSSYLQMCYWEYQYFFKNMLPSLNERGAPITVGTMCLIRRRALEEAGGWAEWCLTEDSELAIRIHALGYTSVYLTTTFGRGLIPETFAGYKKQRFRWTYGPVQELKRHYRLFLPWGRPSKLTAAQKLHHFHHGLHPLFDGLSFLLMPLGGAIVASMVAHQEAISVPLALWAAATVTLVGGAALHWLLFRRMGCSIRDELGFLVAQNSLSYIKAVASLWGFFTKSTPWRRTNKFKALPMGLGALRAAQPELLCGTIMLLFVISAFAALPQSGLNVMLLIGGTYQSLSYFAAVALALLSERDVRMRQDLLSSWSSPPTTPNRRVSRRARRKRSRRRRLLPV